MSIKKINYPHKRCLAGAVWAYYRKRLPSFNLKIKNKYVLSSNGAMALGAVFAVADLALVSTSIGFADGDWCGTLDLAIRSGRPIVEGPLVIECQVLRIGGTLITTKAEILDGDTLAGTAIPSLAAGSHRLRKRTS